MNNISPWNAPRAQSKCFGDAKLNFKEEFAFLQTLTRCWCCLSEHFEMNLGNLVAGNVERKPRTDSNPVWPSTGIPQHHLLHDMLLRCPGGVRWWRWWSRGGSSWKTGIAEAIRRRQGIGHLRVSHYSCKTCRACLGRLCHPLCGYVPQTMNAVDSLVQISHITSFRELVHNLQDSFWI